MAANLIFALLVFLMFFNPVTQVPRFKAVLGLPKNVICRESNGLFTDGSFSRKYELFFPVRYRVFISRSNHESKYITSMAITKSTKHGSTNLVLPMKPFKTDLTICVDISSNPGPRNLDTSKSESVVSKPQCLQCSLPHYNTDANNVYSSSFLHSLRRSQLSKHIDYRIHTYFASLGILNLIVVGAAEEKPKYGTISTITTDAKLIFPCIITRVDHPTVF